MKKIISLFQRNYESDRLVRNELVPGAEWVADGEGVATIKWDGKAHMIRAGKLYKRYDAKKGKQPPVGFEPTQEPDFITGHWPGWLPVGEEPESKWAREAFTGQEPDNTYELIGPSIRSTKDAPYSLEKHILVPHGKDILSDAPRTFEALRMYFTIHPEIEGIVWWHLDGRMVKIKRKDFGLPWPTKESQELTLAREDS